MQITVNLTDPRANSIALDEVIFSQAETTLTFNVSPSTESLADGLSVALLTPQGETLAHALVSASAAVLSTSTVECYEFVKGLPIEAARGAYLVIGESMSPKAIIPVQVARNPIAEIAPPTESAPVYPTAAGLSAIIAEMEGVRGEVNADYQAVKTLAEGFEAEVAQGVSQVQTAGAEAESAINTAKADALAEVNTAKVGAIAAIDTAEASAAAFVEAKAQEGVADITHAAETGVGLVNQASGNAVDEIGAVKTQAEGELTALVGQAQTAKGEAETARDEALVARAGAEAARTGAENAQRGAEQAQAAAEAAQTAAETAAGDAARSAAATAAIKTELQEALTEASGVAGRVTLLETGKGAYKDPETGEMFYFEPLIESDGTIAVIKNNGVAWQIAPVEWAYKGGYLLSYCRAYSDGEYVYFLSANHNSTYADWLYVVYDKNLNRVSPILTCSHLYGVLSSHAGPFACFATDDLVFCQNKATSAYWTCFDKATGAKVADYTPGSGRLLVYNKKTANILAISLAGAVTVLSSSRETVFTELATYDASGIFALQGNSSESYHCSFVNRAAYHTYFCVRNKLDGNTQTLYRVNDDDTISVVNASYATTDADGKVVFEDGVTFDDCIVTKSPVTTENGLIPFNKSVSRTVDGSTKSAWASMPIMFSTLSANEKIMHVISNGLNFYIVLPDGRCVESCSIGTIWPWYRGVSTVSPAALPVLTLGTVEADTFLPIQIYGDRSGRVGGVKLSQVICKSTLPSGTVFPLRDVGANTQTLPTLGDQKAVHAPAPLLASKIALALPMNSPWGIVGVPSHIIRGDFS